MSRPATLNEIKSFGKSMMALGKLEAKLKSEYLRGLRDAREAVVARGDKKLAIYAGPLSAITALIEKEIKDE